MARPRTSRARRARRFTGSRARRSRCTLSIAGTARPVKIATTEIAITSSTRVKARDAGGTLPVPDVVLAFDPIFAEGVEIIFLAALLRRKVVLVVVAPGVFHRLFQV